MRGPAPGTMKDQSALDQVAALSFPLPPRAEVGSLLSAPDPQSRHPEPLCPRPPQPGSPGWSPASPWRVPLSQSSCPRRLCGPELPLPTCSVRESTRHLTGLWSPLRPHHSPAQPMTLGSVRRDRGLLCFYSLDSSTVLEF